MSTAERYRAFARECMHWAANSKDLAHREVLLDMATCWLGAASALRHRINGEARDGLRNAPQLSSSGHSPEAQHSSESDT
jgi:hypothetical protein